MAEWKNWRAMALEAQRAGLLLFDAHLYRSSLSRFYYAAYQGVTAVLLYRKLTPPLGREAWSHDETPQLIVEQLPIFFRSARMRFELRQHLEELYRLRLSADYLGEDEITVSAARIASRKSNYLIKVMHDILPERRAR